MGKLSTDIVLAVPASLEKWAPFRDFMTEVDSFHKIEVHRALRCRGIPLESLREKITPTNEHYLLVHWDVPHISTATWRLQIGGLRPLSLSLADLRSRPAVSLTVTLECAGNGRALAQPRRASNPWHTEAVSTAVWTGTPLRNLLKEAGTLLVPGTKEIILRGLDRGLESDGHVYSYERSMSLDQCESRDLILAYEMNGQDLPSIHGAPLRLVAPGWYGAASVKWLGSIQPISYHFDGPKMSIYKDAQTLEDMKDAEVVFKNRVRALMAPPGIASFDRATRLVEEGRVRLQGRAWTGGGERITSVQVSTNGGATWGDASVEDAMGIGAVGEAGDGDGDGDGDGNGDGRCYAWQEWTFDWEATCGEHGLSCRARDSAGFEQPLEQRYNLFGVGNNGVATTVVSVVKDFKDGVFSLYAP